MTVDVVWQAECRPMDDEAVARAVEAALAFGGREGAHLCVALVDDATLAELHGEWLGDPSPTDVLAFDLSGEGEGPAGEIYASVDCALRAASERGLPVERELTLYLVHGALHLCGFDDREEPDRSRMRMAEAHVLAELGHPSDPELHV